MQSIVDKFNSLFEGIAKAEIIDGRLEVTIDSQTLIIQLPSVTGAQSIGSSSES